VINPERDAISQFAFKLFIGEAVKLLYEQRLEHHNCIYIRTPATLGIIIE
jgi:hypothetical protein